MTNEPMTNEPMTALASPLDLDALARRVDAMRQAGVSGVALSVDDADALIAAARERDALEVRLAAIHMAKLTPVETYLRDTVVTMSELLEDAEAQLADERQRREQAERALAAKHGGLQRAAEEWRDKYDREAASAAYAKDRAERAEQREARLREALVAAEDIMSRHTSDLDFRQMMGFAPEVMQARAALAEGQDG